jgi:exosortase
MSAFPKKLMQPIAIAVALAFVYFTVLVKLSNDWWHDENYSHGLLIPFVIGFILWQERKRLGEMKSEPWAWIGAGGIALSLFMLWAGTAGAELFVQRVSLVLMLISVTIYFFGARIVQLLALPLFLFVLSIPIPQIIFNRVAFPLQLFASRCAVSAMWFLNIPVLRQGNVIEMMPRGATETKRLAVVEACSGIRSLMTLITLAVIYAYFTKPKADGSGPGDDRQELTSKIRSALSSITFWRGLLLVASAVPIAILTNAARVSGTGVLAHHYGTRVADGFFHSFSGWVVYIAAALLLFATAWIFDRVVALWNKKDSSAGSGKPENRTATGQPIPGWEASRG